MESLNFHFLVVEFLKHQEQLSQLGIGVEYLSGASTYDDSLVLTRSSFYQGMKIIFTCARWNMLREFEVSDTMGRKWTHRFNPVDGQPVRIRTGGDSGMVGWLMSSSEIPIEVITFGNQILGMIHEIMVKIQGDQLNFRMRDQI